MSLVGDGTGLAATGAGDEEQGRDPAASGLGTGLGAQVGDDGARVGTGTGVADPGPLGRGLATGLGDWRGDVGLADTGAGVDAVGEPDGTAVVSRVADALAECDAPDAA